MRTFFNILGLIVTIFILIVAFDPEVNATQAQPTQVHWVRHQTFRDVDKADDWIQSCISQGCHNFTIAGGPTSNSGGMGQWIVVAER